MVASVASPRITTEVIGDTYHLYASPRATADEIVEATERILQPFNNPFWEGDYEVLDDGTEHWTFIEECK